MGILALNSIAQYIEYPCESEFVNFLASRENYFHTISCLLVNQAYISKGLRVESFAASLSAFKKFVGQMDTPESANH